MININEHIEEFNGKKYIPLEIAIKAINKPLVFWMFVRAFIINRFRDVVQKV